jgi:phosphate-selective porin OprO/OprP
VTKTKQYKLRLSIAALIPMLFVAPGKLWAADSGATILELFVDQDTKQIYAEPGPNRVKMGDFVPASGNGGNAVDYAEYEQRLEAKQQAYEKKLDEMLAKAPRDEDEVKVKLGKKGLELESQDGNFSMRLGGRMHADATFHEGDDNLVERGTTTPVEATDGTEIRRGRIALSGTLYKDFDYVIESDFGGDRVSVKDLFVNYTGFEPFELTAGHQKHAVSMEIQESSNDIMFTERSLVSALTLPFFDRAIGVNLKSSGKNWSIQGGLYGDSMGSSGNGADEGSGWGARATFAPVNTSSSVVHLGASVGQRKANANNDLANSKDARLRYRTTNMSDFSLTDTGDIAGFDDVSLLGLEAAAMYGPWSIQSEYARSKVARDTGTDLDFDAFYVQMGWTLTGESRTYKGSDGEFKRLKPKHDFSLAKGTWGAWELAARYDQVDLNDADIFGGEQKRATLALNWYLNENVRLMADYSRSFDLDNSPVTKANGEEPDDIDVFWLRTQWAF